MSYPRHKIVSSQYPKGQNIGTEVSEKKIADLDLTAQIRACVLCHTVNRLRNIPL